MNEVIRDELEKIRIPHTQYDEDTTVIYFQATKTITLEIGKSYLIRLEDYVYLGEQGNTLAANWNRGNLIKDKYIKIQISNIMNNMVQFDGTGFDMEDRMDNNNVYLNYWIPVKGFVVMEDIGNG